LFEFTFGFCICVKQRSLPAKGVPSGFLSVQDFSWPVAADELGAVTRSLLVYSESATNSYFRI